MKRAHRCRVILFYYLGCLSFAGVLGRAGEPPGAAVVGTRLPDLLGFMESGSYILGAMGFAEK